MKIWIYHSRIIAAFAVVLLHVVADPTLMISVTGPQNAQMQIPPQHELFIIFTLNILTRWCVPIFVMVSGCLLLNSSREESVISFYRKRASRILIPLIFWSAFYLLLRAAGYWSTEHHLTLKRALTLVFWGKPYFHLWFMYMIFGLYIVTPFLRRTVKHTSWKENLWLCIFGFAFVIINEVMKSEHYKVDWLPAFDFFLFCLPYFLAGWLLTNLPFKIDVKKIWLFLAAVYIPSIFGGFYLYKHYSSRYVFGNLSLHIILISFAVFLLLQRTDRFILSKSLTENLSKMTLGIYLIHPLILFLGSKMGISSHLNAYLYVPYAILIFGISFGCSYAISKIPLLNKTI